MNSDPAQVEQMACAKPRRLALWESGVLCCVSLLLLLSGVEVIVTRSAVPFRGQGPVALDPLWAWVTGFPLIVGGLGLPALVWVFARRHPEQLGSSTIGGELTGLRRRIRVLDVLFGIFIALIVTALLAEELLGPRAWPGRWSLQFFAALATVWTAYKLVRLVLEYSAGVSVQLGRRLEGGPDYERATQPLAFWWAMGIEMARTLLVAGAAALAWVVFMSA